MAPINRSEAEEMISELRTSAILKGVRGEKPLDMKALVENLLRLSQLMMDFPEIEGIDINPVKVLEKGTVAVDARILLSNAQSASHRYVKAERTRIKSAFRNSQSAIEFRSLNSLLLG